LSILHVRLRCRDKRLVTTWTLLQNRFFFNFSLTITKTKTKNKNKPMLKLKLKLKRTKQ